MSADNWGRCPKCLVRFAAKRAALEAAIESQYGKLPLAEYKALEAELADTPAYYEEYELREDYEFYLSPEGDFLADYHASCYNEDCDFQFSFRHKQEVDFK